MPSIRDELILLFDFVKVNSRKIVVTGLCSHTREVVWLGISGKNNQDIDLERRQNPHHALTKDVEGSRIYQRQVLTVGGMSSNACIDRHGLL